MMTEAAISTMSIEATGVTGAKVTSWSHDNPRSLLLELVRDLPHADAETLARHLRDRVLDDDRYLLPIVRYFVRNNMRSLQDRRPRGQSRALVEQAKTKISARLLDMVMPNGKALRDCTGADVRRFGAGFSSIAKKVKPRQLVGQALTETDLRQMLGPT